MSSTRREILQSLALAAAAAGLVRGAGSVRADEGAPSGDGSDLGYRPVITPNGATLPLRVVDGVKVGHLIVEDVRHEYAPGLVGECWGYNGRVHGPTIEAVEGDRLRIYVTNYIAAPTTVHWHGLFVPSGMDGVGGISQRTIEPGETFRYEFTLKQHGTFMYHSHHDEMVQMAMGLMGMFIVHPLKPTRPPVERDFVYMLSEWAIRPGMRRPDVNEMTDFNVLTLNGRVFPGTAPMVARLGERVRIRIGNLSAMDHHPIHLHGTAFQVVETDGGEIPEAGRWPETTVLVPTGSTRTVEFVADNPGDWAMHCHMTHHLMTQMGHGMPNLIGVDPTAFDASLLDHVPEFSSVGEMGAEMTEEPQYMPKNSIAMMGSPGPHGYIVMGGMFTVLKVREHLESYEDPGWYQAPEGTTAEPAQEAELLRDLGEVPPAKAPRLDAANGAANDAATPAAPAPRAGHGGPAGHGR